MPDAGREPATRASLLTEAEVVRLLFAASARAPTGVRNRALIALVYCSGLAPREALALRPEDVDAQAGAVRVPGARARRAQVLPPAVPFLEAWRELRERLRIAGSAPLFCTLGGAPLAPAYVRAALARLARRARVTKRVHVRGLRLAFAARVLAEGGDAAELARQLGHREPRTVRRALGASRPAARGARSVALALRDVPWSLHPGEGEVRVTVVVRERRSVRELAAGAPPRIVVRRAQLDPL